jgi:type I restriction enzyme S subunit
MKMKNLPKGWEIKKLGEVCEIVSGNTPKGLENIKNTGEYQFYKVSDMNSPGNEVKMCISNFNLTLEELKTLKIKIYPKGTVIFPKRGGAILTNKKRLLSKDSSFDLNVMGVLPNEQVGSNFLYYWFQKLDLGKICDGSNVPQINNKNIAPLEIPLPSLETQQRIVAKIEELFSELDKGVEELKKTQEQLKTYRQSVLKWAFEGRFTNENVKDGELPEGWEVKTLKELTLKVEKVKRKEVDEKEELIYLDIGGIDNNFNKIENYKIYKWKDAPSRAQQIVKVNDILFSTVRTYIKNIAMVDKEIYNNQIASSGFTVLRANELASFKYIFYNTISDIFLNVLNELQSGSSYPAVRDSDVFNQKILIPKSLKEQHQIIQEIESRLSVADKLEEQIKTSLQQAEALRQSILKKAFEGELVR